MKLTVSATELVHLEQALEMEITLSSDMLEEKRALLVRITEMRKTKYRKPTDRRRKPRLSSPEVTPIKTDAAS